MIFECVPLSSKMYTVLNFADQLNPEDIQANDNKAIQKALYKLEKNSSNGDVVT